MTSRVVELSHREFLDLPLVRRMAPLFDSDCGLFRQLILERNNLFGIPAYNVSVRLNSLTAESLPESMSWANGSGLTPSDACRRALGEAVERTSAGVYRREDMVFGAYDELVSQRHLLDPADIPTFLPEVLEGLRAQPPRRTSRLWWTEMFELVSGRACWVPSFLVYVPYHWDATRQERFVDFSTTSGVASGDTFVQATMAAIYEIIERDAYCLTWISRRVTPGIANAVPDSLASWCPTLTSKLILKDITNDIGIPVASAHLLANRAELPRLVAAAGARSSVADAALRAVEELVGCANFAYRIRAREQPRPREAMVDFPDHARHWIFQGNPDIELWLQEEGGPNPFSPRDGMVGMATLEAIRNQFQRLGKRLFYKDITPALFRSLGVSVVRCYSPDLQPLYLGDGCLHVISRRLREYYRQVMRREFRPELLNFEPHPFP